MPPCRGTRRGRARESGPAPSRWPWPPRPACVVGFYLLIPALLRTRAARRSKAATGAIIASSPSLRFPRVSWPAVDETGTGKRRFLIAGSGFAAGAGVYALVSTFRPLRRAHRPRTAWGCLTTASARWSADIVPGSRRGRGARVLGARADRGDAVAPLAGSILVAMDASARCSPERQCSDSRPRRLRFIREPAVGGARGRSKREDRSRRARAREQHDPASRSARRRERSSRRGPVPLEPLVRGDPRVPSARTRRAARRRECSSQFYALSIPDRASVCRAPVGPVGRPQSFNTGLASERSSDLPAALPGTGVLALAAVLYGAGIGGGAFPGLLPSRWTACPRPERGRPRGFLHGRTTLAIAGARVCGSPLRPAWVRGAD